MLLHIQLNTSLFCGLFFFLFWFNTVQSQTINKFNCYAVNSDYILYEFNPLSNSWYNKGSIFPPSNVNTNRDIEATALNPIQNVIYTVDRNVFGTIDINTLLFTPVNYISASMLAYGAYGNQLFTDITAMSYDPYSNCIWAINRKAGSGPGTEDYLIKIDPNTGNFIPGTFENGFDYVVIPSIYDVTFGGEVYDVEAIAIDPYSNTLYAIQSQQGSGLLTVINKFDGGIETVIYDFSEDNIKGLSFSTTGMLLGVTGTEGTDGQASFISIDPTNASAINLGAINTSNSSQNFESLTCDAGVFDLALKIDLSSNSNIQIADELTFNIEIFNQGNIEVDTYTMVAYLPAFSFFSLIDDTWNWKGDQIIQSEVYQTVYPGEKHVHSLTLQLDSTQHKAFNIAAEISEFQNRKINEQKNQFISLPDVDSTPDTINNEINIVDNLLSGDGSKSNQDEDDHDIVKINGGRSCENTWFLTNNFISGTYYAFESIVSSSPVVSFISLLNPNSVQFVSGGFITLESGFSIEANTSFEAEIGLCQ